MASGESIFDREELLLGTDAMESISSKRVIIVGVGGVGSWCAESLIRSGIGHLTIVDSDCVCITNVNRQLMATTKTVGQVKVDVLRRRLLDINPRADITAQQMVYCEDTAPLFDFNKYDYVIDAIDSLKDKALLILNACQSDARLFSSMGAALKLDPSHIQVAEFWKVKGDPLAAALRRRFKKGGIFPRRKFKCVFSDELLRNKGADQSCSTELPDNGQSTPKPHVNGTVAHITAIFGFRLAALVLCDILSRNSAND